MSFENQNTTKCNQYDTNIYHWLHRKSNIPNCDVIWRDDECNSITVTLAIMIMSRVMMAICSTFTCLWIGLPVTINGFRRLLLQGWSTNPRIFKSFFLQRLNSSSFPSSWLYMMDNLKRRIAQLFFLRINIGLWGKGSGIWCCLRYSKSYEEPDVGDDVPDSPEACDKSDAKCLWRVEVNWGYVAPSSSDKYHLVGII